MLERGHEREARMGFDLVTGHPPLWLERVAAACLKADLADSRLGDLSEQYFRTRERVWGWFGEVPSPSALAVAHLAADLRYVAAAANVMLFARAVEPGQRLAENGVSALIDLELRERTMAMFRIFMRKGLVPALLLMCSALVLSSALEVWSSWKRTEALMVGLQGEKAQAVAQRIEASVREVERYVGLVGQPQWASLPVEQRRFDYVRLMRQMPMITSLVQLDPDGREQLNVSRLSMDVVGSGVDRSGELAFVEAKAKRIHFGPLYFRKNSEPYVTMAIAHGQRGVTLAELNLKPVLDAVRSIKVGEAGYAYVVDSQYRLVAHPDVALVLRGQDLGAVPQVAAAIANPASNEPFEGKIVTADRQVESVLSVHATVPALGWLVFVDVPIAELRAPFWAAVIRTAGLLALGLVLAAIAVLITVRSTPIGGLRPT